jgi:PAS domain S-box-containing protein
MTKTKAASARNKKAHSYHPSAPAKHLRTRAERLLRRTRREVAQMPVDDVQKLVHELQVHQIELAMQNNELRRTELELEQVLDRYADLYNFAPTAYLTLSADGEILEANLNAGKLLGLERGRLIHQKFTRFVPAEAQDAFYLLRRQALSSDARQSVELDVVDAKSKRLVVLLDAVRGPESPRKQFRVSLTDITERQRAEEALRRSEERYRLLFASSRDAIMILEPPSWRFTSGNPATVEMFRTGDVNRFVRTAPWELSPEFQPDGRPSIEAAKAIIEVATRQGSHFFEWRHKRLDGEEFPASVLLTRVGLEGRTFLQATVRDITERKRAEERIAQLSRVQAVLAGIDRAIVHVPDRQKLLDEVCRVSVEEGGFKLAWIGMVAPDKSVQPVAQAGATGYLKGIHVATHDVPEGRGPVGTAIRENRPVVIEDIDQDARMAPWHDRALRFGLHYVAAFPIRISDRVTGSFQVYAPRAGLFDENELRLLTQVSNDISFALTAIADMTARNQAEEALLESNQFNQQIIASAKDGIIVYSRELKYLVWNPFMEELSGVPAAEVIGKHPLEVFPFLRDTSLIQQLRQALEGATGSSMDFPYLVPQTGRSGWASDINAPLRNAKDKITGVIGIVRDITARKQAEEALRRSEQNLTNFFDHAPIGLEWLSASGSILRANRAQLELLGYRPEEYLGHFIGEFCSDPANARDLLERLAANETVHNLPMPRRRKDGVIRFVLVDARPLWNVGQFLYSSVFSRDVTERFNLEREILEISEREHQRIAQDLHDGLGQLLVGSAYLGNTLRQELAARSLPEVRQLDRLLQVLDKAIGQTRNLARGLHPVKPEPNGLMSALQELASQTKTLFNVRCRFTCRQPVFIEDITTATHLYRIAQEAVTNAIKHGKSGIIQISLTQTAARIVLAVRDNGVGLPTSPRKHRGMGLRIMQYRAGTIGGSLDIQRETGGGTSVVCSVHTSADGLLNTPERATEKKD